VPLIESGHLNAGDEQVRSAVKEYLAPIKEAGADTLILGCTHYPLLTRALRGFLGEDILLVDSGAEAANELSEFLKSKDMCVKNQRRETSILYQRERGFFSSLADHTRKGYKEKSNTNFTISPLTSHMK
jgi:glutamate racemase